MPIRRGARPLAVRAARGAESRAAARASARAAVKPAAPKPLAAKPAAPKPLAVKPRPALPAPEPRLALPAPDPAAQLPPYAAKPRGGQWWTEESPLPMFNPRQALRDEIYMSERFSNDPVDKALLDWWEKAVPRYLQNEMATPNDPLRDLAARGLLHTEMTPDEWSETAGAALAPISLQKLLFDEETRARLGDPALQSMPWLAKLPATETLYGVAGPKLGPLNLTHVRDEVRNALRPEVSGLPADLALRPESLARMSFPQAVERVGRINQFRVKQMEEQQLAALNNPAIQTFKEYPDAGYRWVELRQPEDAIIEGYQMNPVVVGGREVFEVRNPDGSLAADFPTQEEAAAYVKRQSIDRTALQDALRFEGDTMGHCVGGYCDDVLSGRSRIFSLRDAKGQPHVTIETAPGATKLGPLPETKLRDEYPELYAVYASGYSQAPSSEINLGGGFAGWLKRNRPDLAERYGDLVEPQQDIIQIKGKANRAPVDEYLPYVQDFVKSGTWGEIGDFRNTGLVKLPDGRYITNAQLEEVINSPAAAQLLGSTEAARQNLAAWNLKAFDEDDWRWTGPLFEGYAVGGRVERNRCFSRNPLSVR